MCLCAEVAKDGTFRSFEVCIQLNKFDIVPGLAMMS